MSQPEQRLHPRQRVALTVVVSRPAPGPVTAVVDLSEGGAGLDWSLPDDIAVGATVRLSFLLPGGQTIEIDAQVVRIDAGRAGVAFLPEQQRIVRQLMAEARAE